MQTQGASSLWSGSSNLSGLESNWGLGTPYSSGANNMNLLGYGGNSLSNNPGHMQSGASSAFGDSINSNPMLGNNNRGGWGAPGTMPPSQSTNRMPTSSSGNMQGSLPVSGAQTNGPQPSQQSGAFTTSQSPGPNGVPVSSQGNNSAFGSGSNSGFQKISTGNGNPSSGPGMNPVTSINNGSNAQSSDNLDSSGWGVPSPSENSRLMGTNSWGNPSGGDWDQQQSTTPMSQSQSQHLPPSSSSQYQNASNTTTAQSSPSDQQRPSSWAQAAGKGLNLQPNNPAAGAAGNTPSPEELQRQEIMRQQIESHDGWGKKPIRQDTHWSIETSPKVQRKFSTASVVPEQQKGTNNMWNNNNGTAIWEATNKENNSAWNSNTPVARAPGQPPNWNGGQKPPDPSGNQWGGVGTGQAPGPNKNVDSWGGAPETNQSNNNNNWGGSTETGSWGGNFGAAAPGTGNGNTGIATWGDRDGSSAGWRDNQRNSGSNDGTSYWGEPQSKPPQQQQNWNSPVPSGGPPSQPPQAIGQNRGGKMGVAGWGEPIGPPDPKIDDGTSLWAANNQQQVPPMLQARAAGWGETGNQGQWNPAVGKPKPQMPPNPAQFGGVDELNWNIPKEDVWSEESMGGWDDADMGTWNDNAQQTNSSWNSATGWNRDKRSSVKDGAMTNMKFPGGGSHPPQMRSRLLQQLMDMGFKKDEAQHALITNNMNLQNAIADLCNRRGAIPNKRDNDMDVFQMEGPKSRMSGGLLSDTGVQDDISDTQPDSNSFVPNINHMQNTPFNNAQSKIPNQYPFNNGPSLNSQSSLTPNNPSINNALQQKIIQKFQNQQQQPPPPTPQSMNSITPSQGPMGRGQLPAGQQNPAVHQQMAQQQILQQLRMAVQAGLISPQLLNQQLPAPVLVMLQQLLQQQQNLQQLITTQQMLQQPKVGINPMMQKHQLEQCATRINSIKQQILLLQRNISQAQNTLLNKTSQSQQPPQQPSPDNSSETVLQSELSNLTISTSQPQSRLTQWKRSTPDKESPTSNEDTPPSSTSSDSLTPGDSGSLDKAVGSKPIQNSNSTPNLRRFDELGLSNLGGDTTWSTTPTSTSTSPNWPNTSTPSTSTSTSIDGPDNKESQSSTVTTSSGGSVLDSIPAIPEFVPGKPWQGLTKNVDDDPHITPGAFARSLSVNTPNGDYLSSLTKSSPNNESSTWPSKPISSTQQNFASKPWSTGGDINAPGSFTSEIWGGPMGRGGMSRPPPGLPQQQKIGGWGGGGGGGVNRQHSWAGNQTRSDGSWEGNRGGSGSAGTVSTALVLKNLTPQIDGSTLRTLCMQHGPLQCFYLNLAHGQALVKYSTKEEAMKAQKALNTCLLGNTTIVADFVSDVEALRFVEWSASSSSPSQWGSPQVGQQQQQNIRHAPVNAGNQRQDLGMSSWGMNPPSSVNNTLSGTGMWSNVGRGIGGGSGGGLWGDPLEDSAHNLLGNMLGETM